MGRLAAVGVALAVAACGYRAAALDVPRHVRRITVRPLATGSASPRLGGLVAEAIARDLTASGLVVSTARSADAVISGEILESESWAQAIAAGARGPRAALARSEILVLAVLEARDGRVLRRAGPLRLAAVRPIAGAAEPDLLLEDRAMRELAADAARRLVRALFRGP